MSDFIDRLITAARTGRCANDTGADIVVCIDGVPHVLPPGQSTPAGADCDGVIHPDGSATKIHGMTGFREHKSAAWVRANWPGCAGAGGG